MDAAAEHRHRRPAKLWNYQTTLLNEPVTVQRIENRGSEDKDRRSEHELLLLLRLSCANCDRWFLIYRRVQNKRIVRMCVYSKIDAMRTKENPRNHWIYGTHCGISTLTYHSFNCRLFNILNNYELQRNYKFQEEAGKNAFHVRSGGRYRAGRLVTKAT